MKKKTYKKTSIKRVIKFIKGLSLLLAMATSLLYFMFIIIISMYNYLYNRPIRTAVLFVALGIVFMFIDEIDQVNSRTKQHKAHARHISTRKA